MMSGWDQDDSERPRQTGARGPQPLSEHPMTPRKKLSSKKAKKPKKSRKSFFVRGLVTLLPAVMTIIILVTVVQFVERYLTSPINSSIYSLLDDNAAGWKVLGLMEIDPYDREFLDEEALPLELQDALLEFGGTGTPEFQSALANYREETETFLRDHDGLAIDHEKLREATRDKVPPIIGILISVVIVLTLGYLASGFLGRRLISSFDKTLTNIPIIRSVYPYTKQVVDFFLSDNDLEFDTVVAAPYPSADVWAIGFVTSAGLKSVHDELGGRFLAVFIPTSPMPMTGFTVFIEASRLVPLDMTIDEALRVTVSAGVLVPDREHVALRENDLRDFSARQPESAEAPEAPETPDKQESA
jgi:uncharacterized membrane protein